MKPARTCANCAKSRPISFTNDVLCKHKGVVSASFSCLRHRFIPNLKSFKEMDYKCIDCANFIVHDIGSHPNQTMGLCRLFSVRQYNGNKKKACSRFIMNYESKLAILNSNS